MFNRLIEDKIKESNLPGIFKEFIEKILLLELESLSEGTKWKYSKEYDDLIAKYTKKYLEGFKK